MDLHHLPRVVVVERAGSGRRADGLGEDGRFEVRRATSGFDAGLLIEKFRPELLIMDDAAGDVDCELVCQRLRQDRATSAIKIIIIGDHWDNRRQAQLPEAGADEFIGEPCGHRRLLRRAAVHLKLSS